jgi:hypothetical protein
VPTIALLDSSDARGDGWHRVIAPGGFEWWHFFVSQPAGDVRVIADFFYGNPFDPKYLRRFRDYRASPTQNAPPTPAEFPAVRLAIYEGNTCLLNSWAPVEPAKFSAVDSELCFGESRIIRETGGWRLRISAEASVEMQLTPTITGPVGAIGSADYRWIVTAPLCDAHGTIRLPDRQIEIHGLAYHDHRYGVASPATAFSRWLRGCVLRPGASAAIELAIGQDTDHQQICRAVVAANGTVEPLEFTPSVQWQRRGLFGIPYPQAITIGHRLALCRPQRIEQSCDELTLNYDGFIDGMAAPALCQIADFDRMLG